MRMTRDSSVKSETNTQHGRRRTGAFTEQGQSEACSVAPWVPSVWALSGGGGRAELGGVGVGVPGGVCCRQSTR